MICLDSPALQPTLSGFLALAQGAMTPECYLIERERIMREYADLRENYDPLEGS